MPPPDDAIRAGPPPARPAGPELDLDGPPAGEPSPGDRSAALWCHVGGFLTWLLVPAIVMTLGQGKSRFLVDHAKEALNFQITLTIYYLVGCVIFPVVMVFELVTVIQAARAASRGEPYRYPLNIRFVK